MIRTPDGRVGRPLCRTLDGPIRTMTARLRSLISGMLKKTKTRLLARAAQKHVHVFAGGPGVERTTRTGEYIESINNVYGGARRVVRRERPAITYENTAATISGAVRKGGKTVAGNTRILVAWLRNGRDARWARRLSVAGHARGE